MVHVYEYFLRQIRIFVFLSQKNSSLRTVDGHGSSVDDVMREIKSVRANLDARITVSDLTFLISSNTKLALLIFFSSLAESRTACAALARSHQLTCSTICGPMPLRALGCDPVDPTNIHINGLG